MRKKRILEIRDDINAHFENYPVKVDISDQYFNMAEKILPLPHIIDIPKRVFAKLDIPANTEPIRGGTDGSQLSFMGLPTPNIFTGCGNFTAHMNMHPLMLWKGSTSNHWNCRRYR